MANLVVVAIPEENDHVWKISSEKIPHMTLLFLGEMPVSNFVDIANFVAHASQRSLSRFGMDVNRRGTLGDGSADVLFFAKNKFSDYEGVAAYRSFLLQDSKIRAAYESVEQFPEWVPHLTLGHPEKPAKPDTRSFPGISYVRFDKIALWFNDFDGFEYPLSDSIETMEVAMSSSSTDRGRAVTEHLIHVGVKGMKWGVRRAGSRVHVSRSRVTGNVKTVGGVGRKPSADAKKAKVYRQISKKSGYQALSNAQIKAYNERQNLEKQAKKIDLGNSVTGQFIDLLLKTVK